MSDNKSGYKVTFTRGGYIVGVFYNRSKSATEAIESAKLHCINKFTHARAEPFEFH